MDLLLKFDAYHLIVSFLLSLASPFGAFSVSLCKQNDDFLNQILGLHVLFLGVSAQGTQGQSQPSNVGGPRKCHRR